MNKRQEQTIVPHPPAADEDEINKRHEQEVKKERVELEERLKIYLPLYKAALKGDWETASNILENDSDALTAHITFINATVLHVAVSNDRNINFLEKLLQKFNTNAEYLLTSADGADNTALSYAAIVGNTKAAELLVEKNPRLLETPARSGNTPLHLAAIYRQKKTLDYLLSKSKHLKPSLPTQQSHHDNRLLFFLIHSDFYGMALDLIKDNPNISPSTNCIEPLASKPQAFASGSRLGYWQRIIYQSIFVEMDNVPLKSKKSGDVENPSDPASPKFHYCITGTLCRKVSVMFWITIASLVPGIKDIQDAMLMHKQTRELVKHICKEVTLGGANDLDLLKKPLFEATRMGIVEIVTEIIKTNPNLMWVPDEDGRSVFHLAVLHRQEKIFSLLYQMGSSKFLHAQLWDKFHNTLLHLAGELAPSTCISGAALQMQRELQWFKEVENFVGPALISIENKKGKTPRMVFTEAHAELVEKGEKWMKNIAKSCTVVVALTVTMMFAAAFTTPGDKGSSILSNKPSFMVFAVSDVIGLFSSSTSLLMFLGMLTTRYSEEDFLKSLPNKLIIGLFTLFISIASMVVAFSAAMYIVLAHQVTWILVPIGLLACVPITLFAFLQFPLLVEIYLSTHGPSIFHQKSEGLFN